MIVCVTFTAHVRCMQVHGVFSASSTGCVGAAGESFFVTAVSHWPGFHLDVTPTFREIKVYLLHFNQAAGDKKVG